MNKMHTQMLSRLLTIPLLLAFTPVIAQDLHFSQFYHHPLHLNPAATGVFPGTWRIAGLYRSQWASVPVDYRTFAAAFDSKLVERGGSQISGGLLLERDRAGDGRLSWTQVGLSGSLARALSDRQTLVAGLALALAQRSIDVGRLKFKNQWTGDVYDASLPTGESFGPSSGLVPTLSAGLLWRYAPVDTRTYLTVGLGAAHLNRPVLSFRDDTPVKLPMRFNLQLQGSWQLNDVLDLVGFSWAQQMTTTREIVIGAGMRRILTTGPANLTAVQFSLATRVGDAFIPAVQLERNNWTLGLSYDCNVSGFQVATGYRGGFELAAVYRYMPVPSMPVSKSCPIF